MERKKENQMKKRKPNKTSESGITLVALIVTIILLVILTAVVIRNITAGDNLIDTTMTAREEYNLKSYRQQIESVVQSVIVRK